MAGKSLLAVGISGSQAFSSASTTVFFAPNMGLINTTSSLTETEVEVTARKDAVVNRIGIRVNSNSRSTDSEARLRKNGGNGNCVVTVPAGNTGYFEDTVNSDTLAPGDTFCFAMTNGSGSGNMFVVYIIAALTSVTGNAHNYYGCRLPLNNSAIQSTFHQGICGDQAQLSDSDSVTRMTIPCDGTFSNLQAYVSLNSKTGTTTFRSRVNGANGAQSFTVSAGMTGLFEDTSNSDTISAGDRFGTNFTTVGTGNLTVTRIGCMFVGTADETFVGGRGGSVINNSTRYAMVAGDARNSSSENQADIKWPFDCTFSNFYVRGDSFGAVVNTMTLRINGADTSLEAQSSGSAGAAMVSDLVNSEDVEDGDFVNMQWVCGAATTTTGWSIYRVTNPAPAPPSDRKRRIGFAIAA